MPDCFVHSLRRRWKQGEIPVLLNIPLVKGDNICLTFERYVPVGLTGPPILGQFGMELSSFSIFWYKCRGERTRLMRGHTHW